MGDEPVKSRLLPAIERYHPAAFTGSLPPMERSTWKHYLNWHVRRACPTGLELDLACAGMSDAYIAEHAAKLEAGLEAMQALEEGATANPDENRRVGHYWLRAPEYAPDADTRAAIEQTRDRCLQFAAAVHTGDICPPDSRPFSELLVIGIGGSALGVQLLADALCDPLPPLNLHVFDNTDPDGYARILEDLDLARTLVVVISKSGSTVETRNGMLTARAAFGNAGRDFAKYAVAVTGVGSQLMELAVREDWLATFPMWDWVGGRTSVCSAVGLLPAALLGIDVQALLAGAAGMDAWTRSRAIRENPATLLAAFWYAQPGRAMVVLPYRDRLQLLSRYLQQLVMESLGKRLDRSGREVWQGLTVYGNKGSTDQHAYVQQLRDGRHDFFACFIRVLTDAPGDEAIEVEPGVTASDCLDGFYQGTRTALTQRGRHSATIILDQLDAAGLGAVIALFERTVGVYAEMLDINAYHQPGVEAGKKAARGCIEVGLRLQQLLAATPKPQTCEQLAQQLNTSPMQVWMLVRRLVAQGRVQQRGEQPDTALFFTQPHIATPN